MKFMLLRRALLGSVFLIGSCQRDGEAGGPGGKRDSGNVDPCIEKCASDAGLCRLCEDDCHAFWEPGPLPEPWWESDPPTTCSEVTQHDPPQYYDDCNWGDLVGSPTTCVPPSGAVVCEGRLTTSCRTAADCPASMACTSYGTPYDNPDAKTYQAQCTKTCTGTGGPGECIRCGLACIDGLCDSKLPEGTGRPCRANCDCYDVGFCGGPDYGCRMGDSDAYACGTDQPWKCPCAAGVCDGYCCVLSDGTIANREEAGCDTGP